MCWEFLCVTTLYLEIDKIEYGKFGRYKDFILNNLDYLKYGLGSKGFIGQHEQDIWPWWIKYKDISFHCLHAKKDNFTFSWWMCCVGVDWISTCLWQVTNLQLSSQPWSSLLPKKFLHFGWTKRKTLAGENTTLSSWLIDWQSTPSKFLPFSLCYFFIRINKAWQSEAW